MFETQATSIATATVSRSTTERSQPPPPGPLTDGDLDVELVALLRLRHRLDAEVARRAACWDRRSVWRGDGSRAPWARLSRSTHLGPGTAKAILRRGHAVASKPRTAEAWAGRRDRRRPRRSARRRRQRPRRTVRA